MAQPSRQPLRSISIAQDQTEFASSTSLRPAAFLAYRALQTAFVVAPVVAGVDKFFHALVDWDQYVAPLISNTLGTSTHFFMLGVGVIEIIAGIGVFLRPRVFSYVVAGWLGGIIINLLLTGKYFDIALRDLGLAIGAFALAQLAGVFDSKTRRPKSPAVVQYLPPSPR